MTSPNTIMILNLRYSEPYSLEFPPVAEDAPVWVRTVTVALERLIYLHLHYITMAEACIRSLASRLTCFFQRSSFFLINFLRQSVIILQTYVRTARCHRNHCHAASRVVKKFRRRVSRTPSYGELQRMGGGYSVGLQTPL